MLKIFNIFDFNLNLYKNNHIFIMFFKKIVYFSICIYRVSCPIIFKSNISMYQVCVVSDKRIVFAHHRF